MPSGGAIYTFGNFELDARARVLKRQGERVALSDRYLGVLLHLAAHAGTVVSKDDLVQAGWGETAVGDNSIEQAISALRRALGVNVAQQQYVETVPRQGYRLAATVTRTTATATDDDLEALLAPHRALLDGRAALESLTRDEILRARDVFAEVVARVPDAANGHVGLANACVLQFEMTRADERPDLDALKLAAHHAYEACRIDTGNAEAWSTLSFIIERVGQHTDALAAARRAISLEPDSWRHHFRLASIAWGEERLRAARRTLALLPGFALAHWLAASVLVARNMLDEAARELDTGIAAQQSGDARYSAVALHWLRGLIHLARGEEAEASAEFERELARETSGHLYARECCANTWYAIGAAHLRAGRPQARAAFSEALRRLPRHGLARVGSAAAEGTTPHLHEPHTMDEVLCAAALHVRAGDHARAAVLVEEALATVTAPNAAWLLPVEPLLHVTAGPEAWTPVLARLRLRAM